MTVKVICPAHLLANGSVPFIRPKFSLTAPDASTPGALSTLPDLVQFNAFHNPTHLFCVQYGRDIQQRPRSISSSDLYNAVLRFSAWLAIRKLAQVPRFVNGEAIKAPPVAILMASDVGWFVSFLALLRLGVPVLCLSTRLAPQAVAHLLRSTRTQAVLVSPQLVPLANESLALLQEQKAIPSVHLVPSYSEFLDINSELDPNCVPVPPHFVDDRRDAVILHSSGTTGLPKPIFHSQTYMLGYAACHKLSSQDVEGAINVSTLPLFHGFGLLAPSLALSVGMPFAIPASGTIPTGSSTLHVLNACGATSLMTVPSILEELYQIHDGVDALRKLRFVAVGGAPMKNSVAEPLVSAGVPILNHWGLTEIGAVAPILVPPRDYDWHYLRVRDDIGLRFEPVEGDQYRLVGCPPGTDAQFVAEDLLVANPQNPRNEFRIMGRTDDLMVLATGEKVRPTLLEQLVSEDPLVRGAVAFGDGKFQLGLLIEAAQSVVLDISNDSAVSAYIDTIWPTVTHANEMTDRHGRVSREMILVTTPAAHPLARTPKGSIPRRTNVELFKEKIEELYSRADVAGAQALPIEDLLRMRDEVRRLVVSSFASPRAITDDEDFFENGMDSLQATMLRRHLAAAVSLTLPSLPLPSDIVYANPSVSLLAGALAKHCSGQSTTDDADDVRLSRIQSVMEDYVAKVASLADHIGLPSHPTSSSSVVLLTGSTGSLGSALLEVLASSPHIVRIHALNRKGSRSLRDRQAEGLKKLGVDLGANWTKVVLHEVDFAADRFGLNDETYASFNEVTHVIHNAWPMDFNRSLTSFVPHLEATLNIIRLALSTTRERLCRVLFSSSIAVVGRSPIVTTGRGVAEIPYHDPSVIDHFGYAEAKWICERMFEEASRLYSHKLSASNVRIGQMTGAESTGAWNTAEHFPMIVKSCVAVGKVPRLDGTASWIPVDRAARIMGELLLLEQSLETSMVFHLENPVRQPWSDILSAIARSIGVSTSDRPTFQEWLDLVRKDKDAARNPCTKLIPFLEHDFVRMASQVELDTSRARSVSPTLENSQPLSSEHLAQYVAYWKAEGFI